MAGAVVRCAARRRREDAQSREAQRPEGHAKFVKSVSPRLGVSEDGPTMRLTVPGHINCMPSVRVAERVAVMGSHDPRVTRLVHRGGSIREARRQIALSQPSLDVG